MLRRTAAGALATCKTLASTAPRQRERVKIAALERAGVAQEAYRCIAAAAAAILLSKPPQSLIALRTQNAVDAPQRCE